MDQRFFVVLRFLKKFTGNSFDRLLRRAASKHRKNFLVVWNRGLGDIALGLYALVTRIRQVIPDAHITFLTRPELQQGFSLLPNVEVLAVPSLQRGEAIDVAGALQSIGRDLSDWDLVLEKVNATDWFSWQIGKLTPRLQWNCDNDRLIEHFGFKPDKGAIAVHVSTETQKFYGYQKDWPRSCWYELFEKISERSDQPIIVFGLRKEETLPGKATVDLRGRTSLLEMLSLIKNCAHTLIAPDGGVLSLAYYLDVPFPITIVSLWADPRQGILKQNVPSPNPLLIHLPLVAKEGQLQNLSVDEVVSTLPTNR